MKNVVALTALLAGAGVASAATVSVRVFDVNADAEPALSVISTSGFSYDAYTPLLGTASNYDGNQTNDRYRNLAGSQVANPGAAQINAAVSDGNANTAYAIGYHGLAIFELTPAAISAQVVEITSAGTSQVGQEKAEVFYSANGIDWIFAQTLVNGSGESIFEIAFSPAAKYLMFVDRSTYSGNSAGEDGFDIVSISAVPLPSAAGMGLAALGVLGARRRR